MTLTINRKRCVSFTIKWATFIDAVEFKVDESSHHVKASSTHVDVSSHHVKASNTHVDVSSHHVNVSDTHHQAKKVCIRNYKMAAFLDAVESKVDDSSHHAKASFSQSHMIPIS